MRIVNIKDYDNASDEIDEIIEQYNEELDTTDLIPDWTHFRPEEGCKDTIELYEPAFRFENLGLIVVEGVWLAWNEEEDCLEPDFDVSVIYEDVPDDEFDENKWLYWEQDPAVVALHNYLHAKNISE